MVDSIRQKIVDDFKTRMQTITTGNGYETNLGSNIFVWRTEDWQESELPGGDIRDGDEDVEVVDDLHIFTLDMELEVKVSGTVSRADIRKIIADVTVAVGVSKFSSYILTAIPVSNETPDFDKKDKLFGSIIMKFQVTYTTGAFDPYNSA